MTEKTLYLEGINLVDFYGVNNSKLNIIQNYFPKIKIIARSNELKIMGDATEVERFEEKLSQLLEYLSKYNSYNEQKLERLLLNFEQESTLENDEVIAYTTNGKQIKPRSATQQKFVEECKKNDLVLAVGPAGTGKTFLSIALAVKALKNKEVRRIVISRPAVEAEEKIGFLPGDLKEKLDPYLQPIYDALNELVPSKKLEELFFDKVIEIAPIAFMRGRTLSNSFVILDEAQNATVSQLKMFFTRMGENSKFIVTGDVTQIDLPNKQNSGLYHAVNIFKDIEGISIVEFNKHDISRHRLVKYIVDAYDGDSSK